MCDIYIPLKLRTKYRISAARNVGLKVRVGGGGGGNAEYPFLTHTPETQSNIHGDGEEGERRKEKEGM